MSQYDGIPYFSGKDNGSMENIFRVDTVRHGAAVFGIAALAGAVLALVYHFIQSPVASLGTKVASKV